MIQVRRWLLSCLILIAGIVLVGGATRLTGSGLSMVDWRPIMGSIPPITAAAWDATFNAYQQSPEFQKNQLQHDIKRIQIHLLLGIHSPHARAFDWPICRTPIYLLYNQETTPKRL